jgi:hypothetical protein
MFKYTICEPLNPTIVDKGNVTAEQFRNVLQNFPWIDMLRELENAEESKVCYSPSLELVDPKSNHSLAISIVGPESELEYYIFYKRPKTITKRKWFKTVEVFKPEYLTDRTGQSEKDVEDAFNALLEGNFELLESRWG